MPRPALFDFRDPLPMPAGAERLVLGLTDAVPRVGMLLGAAAGRTDTTTSGGVRRAALVEVAVDGDVWAPLACGLPGTCLLVGRYRLECLLGRGNKGIASARP